MARTDFVKKIDERNSTQFEKLFETSFIENEFQGYYPGLINCIWTYAKLSGIKEICEERW